MGNEPPPTSPDELARQIINAEYNYIAQTAFQANEDRARAWQYFFVTFATLIAALLSTQMDGIDRAQIYRTFVVIFLLLAGLGFITILQLVRLRQAWLESARAMNQMKERLMADDPALADYFRWNNDTLPAPFKLRSFGFLQALELALLSGLALGAAVAFWELVEETAVPWGLAVAVGLLGAALILWLGYIRPLQATAPVAGPESQVKET